MALPTEREMLMLYHSPLSVSSHKVRLVLTEKGLRWEDRFIDLLGGEQHGEAYKKVNPDGLVPSLIHEGYVLSESHLINEYLDEAFPDPPLMSSEPRRRHMARLWVQRAADHLHAGCGVLSYAIAGEPMLRGRPETAVEGLIAGISSTPVRRWRQSVHRHGLAAPELADALDGYLAVLDQMEQTLSVAPWLAGEQFSLADASVFPYVLRLQHLGLASLIDSRVRPQVARWNRCMMERPSHTTSFLVYCPDALIASMRELAEAAWSATRPLAVAAEERRVTV